MGRSARTDTVKATDAEPTRPVSWDGLDRDEPYIAPIEGPLTQSKVELIEAIVEHQLATSRAVAARLASPDFVVGSGR
jgi:hypothetical protein